MAEVATIFQTTQIGVEVTPGTGVACPKLLTSMGITPSIKASVKKFRPAGQKYATIGALGKEWSEAKIEGALTYTEVIYILSSLVKAVTPATEGTLGKKWTFSSAQSDADTVKTFTVENGSSVRARKFTYGIIPSCTFSFTREEAKLDGTMLGRALTDGITMTATPTAIDLIPVLTTDIDIKIATTAAGLPAASPLNRALSFEFALTDRFGPIFPLLSSLGSGWATHVELEPKLSVKLKVEADAEGMGVLTDLRDGDSVFIRLHAVGPELETGTEYEFIIDACCKVEEPSEFSDEDGVYALEWNLFGAYDPTWTKSFEIVVINKQAAL